MVRLEAASPLEIAALWRRDLLTGPEIASISMRWLEHGLDQGNADIAAFAGESNLLLREAGPAFGRFLHRLIGREMGEDEALLRALNLHLAAALDSDDLMEGVALVLARFVHVTERRLVHDPRRARDHPTGTYAEQELGLEYVYGGYYAFDDIQHLGPAQRLAAEHQLRDELRADVRELHEHLTTGLHGPARE